MNMGIREKKKRNSTEEVSQMQKREKNAQTSRETNQRSWKKGSGILLYSHQFWRLRPFFLAFFGDACSQVGRNKRSEATESQDPGDAIVARCATRLLEEFEDGTRDERRNDLRRGDGDIVDTKNDASLVIPLFVLPADSLSVGRRRHLVAASGVALGNLGSNERERGPIAECPGNTDEGYQYSTLR